MYSTTEHYKQAIQKSNPSYLTGTITFVDGSSREFDDKTIALGGVSITMQSVTQDILEFGATVLGQLDISLKTDKDESRYKYYDAVIELYFHIETEQGVETIPLGKFIVAEAEKNKGIMVLCAYDMLFKFDKKFSLQLVGTPYDIMSTLAKDCECELAEDEDYYKDLPNGDLTLTLTESSSCTTYRQAASIVAQMCGCFIQADRYGKLIMRPFSADVTFALTKSQRYSSVIADYVCKYTQIVATGLAGEFIADSEVNAEGLVLNMEDAPAWDSGTEDTLQTKVNNLMLYLDNLKYTPGELSIISDPSIDCGDLAFVETDDSAVNMLITSYTWKYRSQMELVSVGKNPYLINKSANTHRVIRDLEVNGTGGGSPQTLYTFKNTRKFKCTNKLEPLAYVTFVATKETFVMFDATFQVDVDVADEEHTSTFTVFDTATNTNKTYEVPYKRDGRTNISIQYYYNNNALIEPYVTTLEKGSHIITLHYPLSNVEEDSTNRFDIRMSADNGAVSVAKDAFMGTISGQGLAGKPKWDGTITVDEVMGAKYPIAKFDVLDNINTTVSFHKNSRDDINALADRFNIASIASIMTIGALGFNDEFGVNKVVTNYTMNTEKAHLYEFDRNYVLSDKTFRLVAEFDYVATDISTDTVDSGVMCAVAIRTDDKTAIESVVIED